MSTKKDKADKAESPSSNGNTSADQPKPECFIIMPISDPDGYEPGHFRRVYEDLFVPACDRAGYTATRADKVRQTNLIHLDVLQKIIDSPMAICDLSNRNPNVMFELGLRQAFDKPVVLVQERGTPPIFDITPLRYTEYSKGMLYREVIEDQESIAAAIAATKEAIGSNKSVNSIVKLLSLTHSAALASFSEDDKESAVLQVIMSELGNLRNEIRNIATRGESVSVSKDSANYSPHAKRKVEVTLSSIDRNILKINDKVNSYIRGESENPQLEPVIEMLSKDINELWGAMMGNGTVDELSRLALLDGRLNEISNRYRGHVGRQGGMAKDG